MYLHSEITPYVIDKHSPFPKDERRQSNNTKFERWGDTVPVIKDSYGQNQ